MTQEPRIDAAELEEFACALLTAAGVSASAAMTVAGSLVDADLRGTSSHGVMLLPMYLDRLRAGSVSPVDRSEVLLEGDAFGLIDAHHSLGQLTASHAMDLAVARAQRGGVGLVVVRHAFHFGAAYQYAESAARQGCIGVAAANTRPLMPAPGGAMPAIGNNPLAIGVPTTDRPLVLDMATSQAALGKIRMASRAGERIPDTWATDASGTPTTDPDAALGGMLLPAGGPKGFGLALMIEILSGVLANGGYGSAVKGLYGDPATPNDCAHVFVAIDPEMFGGRAGFAQRVTTFLADVRAGPLAASAERITLPGMSEAERKDENAKRGLQISSEVIETLRVEASRADVNVPDKWATPGWQGTVAAK